MLKEEEIHANVMIGDCAMCKHGVIVPHRKPNDEVDVTFDCTIEDIKKCPVVIHDMSL